MFEIVFGPNFFYMFWFGPVAVCKKKSGLAQRSTEIVLKKCSGMQANQSDIKKTVNKKKFGLKKAISLWSGNGKVGPDLFKVGLGPTSWQHIKKYLARPLGPQR